jgi:imidazolonepropionase
MSTAKHPFALLDASVVTMVPQGPDADGDAQYGLIDDAALVIDDDRVVWIGPRLELPAEWKDAEPYPVGGRLITPGLVECHTHLLFAGDRRKEFAARHPGSGTASSAGGDDGIHATVTATRAASDEEILAAAVRHAWWFIRQGVTTLEVKTGYGLDRDGELRLLRIADRLRAILPIQVRITLLAGHAYPPGTDREEYVLHLCDELLPAAIEQGIFDFVEVYCEETTGISMEDASTILETVYRKKIPTRVSADHLSDSAGGALAPAFYSKAAAHLDYTDDIAVTAMGKAGTTAVLVPASGLELGPPGHRPPVTLLREQNVPMAVSTGFDPGPAPLADLRTAAHLACVMYGLSLPEALRGITTVAARALALDDSTGTVAAGGPADIAIWDAAHPEDLVYWLGVPACHEVWAQGRPVEFSGLAR